MADYDIDLQSFWQINVVPNILIQKLMAIVMTHQKKLIEEMMYLDLEAVLLVTVAHLTSLQLQLPLIKRFKAAQKNDYKLQKLMSQIEAGQGEDLSMHVDRSLRFRNRLCAPRGEVRLEVL